MRVRLYMYHVHGNSCFIHKYNAYMIQYPTYTRMHAMQVVHNANQSYVSRRPPDRYLYSPHVTHTYVRTAQYRDTRVTTTQ